MKLQLKIFVPGLLFEFFHLTFQTGNMLYGHDKCNARTRLIKFSGQLQDLHKVFYNVFFHKEDK